LQPRRQLGLLDGKEFLIPMNSKIKYLILLTLFLLSCGFVLFFAEINYSDAKHFHMGYTDIWLQGMLPYFQHLYEYPHFSIPLILMPRLIELVGVGNYYLNYRLLEFALTGWIFIMLMLLAKKKKISSTNILLFIVGVFIGQYYIFEGIDMGFSAAFVTALVLPQLINKESKLVKTIIFWFFMLLSSAIKFMTAPLVPLFFIIRVIAGQKSYNIKKIIKSKSFKTEFMAAFIVGLIIWVIPALFLRKRVLIPVIFHTSRPLHLSSFPAYIVQTVDSFIHTETERHYEYTGPFTSQVLSVSNTALVAGLAFIYLWITYKIFILKKSFNPYMLKVKTMLVYLWLFLLTAKLFSPPFNLWYLCTVAVYPFFKFKKQLLFYLLVLWSMALNMTNWIELGWGPFIGPFNMAFAKGLLRFVPILVLFVFTLGLPEDRK
jgi:hypothetical protein